ncbi:MAG: acyl-CoA thioesterase [Gammaproteobacteria bacterium]|nr:acyl-CoA thioesterase [Gammaproteobacteria bacterium]
MSDCDLPARIDLQVSVPLVVTFHDADPAGVAWHGNYFRYFEVARCALLERISYGYRTMMDGGLLWPIVQAEVKYIRALPFDARIRVTARLVEWEYRLKIAYEVLDAAGRRATTAHTVQVAVDAASGEMHIGAPEALRERLRVYLRDLEANR